jgi:hypothetical protein
MRFHATLELGGKTATGIEVPLEIIEGLGSGKRPAVCVTINGFTFRTTVAPMGGKFYIPVSAERREGAGIAAGDDVDVDIELDTEPRELTLPPDFADALDADARAKEFFDGLSFSNRQWHVQSIEGAKKPETRQRRIERSISMLREGKAR